MNTLKTTMSKIAQIEQLERTDLAKHEVELAIADKLKTYLKSYTDIISKYGKELDAAYTPIRELEKTINILKGQVSFVNSIAQELRKAEDNVSNELDLVRKKIQETQKELGIAIDINDIVNLSSLQSSNTLSANIQKDAADYVKYVNTLVKPTI